MRYESIIKQMTLAEKVSLLAGKNEWQSKNIDRLQIPSLFCSDGPHGLRKQAGEGDHLGLNPSVKATCFPTAATIANSWDLSLGEAIGAALGREARAQDVNVLLGPGLNIKRNPLCGRNFEYFSEDPYLAGKLAAGYIRGIQGEGVAACPKHFAVNSQETLRMANDSILDERTLREIYLTAFEIAVKEAQPLSIMSSYNRINGVYANENETLLRDILVREWGFDGAVISDWGASNSHTEGVRAGSHLEMPAPGIASDLELFHDVQNGTLPEAVLDERVDEFLHLVFATEKKAACETDFAAHHALARKAAQESIVLLKNEQNLLPLASGTAVAVIGDFAKTPRYQGAGSSLVNAVQLDTALELLPASGLGSVGYAQGFARQNKPDAALLAEAVALAKTAQAVLLYLGLDEMRESEGLDRADMALAQNQIDVLTAVSAVNPNVVVVLSAGSALEMPWLPHCRALVHATLGGQAGAGAVLDVLTGKVNPSGKLAETYPVRYSDVPSSDAYPGTATSEYREGIYVGYRYFEKTRTSVCFPFGYGLSYTSFAYSALQVNEKEVSFTLQNTGKTDGAEIAQVYIGKEQTTIFRAVKELKGFAKVFLKAGESKKVTIALDDKAFRYWNSHSGRFETEGGTYTVSVGASSADICLTAPLMLDGTLAPAPYSGLALPHYESGQVNHVPDAEFAALLGRSLPPCEWDKTKPLSANDTFAQLFYAKSFVGRLVFLVLATLKNKAEAKGTPDLNILFIYNMPFRALGKMTAGAVDTATVEALVYFFNGHFWGGIYRAAKAFLKNKNTAKQWRQQHDTIGY